MVLSIRGEGANLTLPPPPTPHMIFCPKALRFRTSRRGPEQAGHAWPVGDLKMLTIPASGGAAGTLVQVRARADHIADLTRTSGRFPARLHRPQQPKMGASNTSSTSVFKIVREVRSPCADLHEDRSRRNGAPRPKHLRFLNFREVRVSDDAQMVRSKWGRSARRLRPKSANFGPVSATLGPIRPILTDVVRHRPILPNSCQF